MRLRIVIAPDKFKDALTAPDAAEAIAAGAGRAAPEGLLDLCPMADGGEGTVAALAAATGGRIIHHAVTGPLPQMKVHAALALLGDGATAVIEMSAASGLALLRPEQRNPLHTTSYGTGELIRHAISLGARRIILGIGGSATVDGGLGCAQACGMRLWTRANPARSPYNIDEALPVELLTAATGADLLVLHSLERPDSTPGVEILVACDVSNPLTGPSGAAAVYGPQKGATPEMVRLLDEGLAHLAQRSGAPQLAEHPGAGAAGGLGFAMLTFFSAQLRPGIELVMEATHLRRRLANADLCITGEGRFDESSLAGKAPVGVARACAEAGVPCIALVGSVSLSAGAKLPAGLTAVFPIGRGPADIATALAETRESLSRAAEQAVRLFLTARGRAS
jgi:glycerate kinase